MARTVVGVFDTEEAAKQAVEALVRAGISRSDISLVAADARGTARTASRAIRRITVTLMTRRTAGPSGPNS